MRRLHTLVFAGCFVMSAASCAEAQSADSHPTLGTTPPREFLNEDLMDLPQREQQAWLHGAMTSMAQVLASKDPETGKCIMEWYFEVGDGAQSIPMWIARYPEKPVSSTIVAVASKACPNL